MKSWNGKVMVDLREFYVKDGKDLPTRKGTVIALSCTNVKCMCLLAVALCGGNMKGSHFFPLSGYHSCLFYCPSIIHVDVKCLYCLNITGLHFLFIASREIA